ncbi:hypothetical protein [Zeaxanthinibacter enoshimensis]|uniref:Uncharacterized protein n=1 Tax=Zeaxanthinibacter enoshimensis TaxID=392009 RepID=A0A4R6TLZ8_9FLAO|nr:hypothetical protein CLV82_2635 [Zeaxanthinibacter enoshimensis]
MFSTGQWIFAAVFVVVFTIFIILSYKKDRNLHRKNYKGVIWVGIVFITFIILLFIIKQLLR